MQLDKFIDLIATLLVKVKSKKQMTRVLEDLLTPQEIVELHDRIRIFQEIQAGKTQRAISEDLGISVTTVNRGSRVMKFGTGEIGKIL